MAKTKYVARLNGEIVGTRSSDRIYTHAVICSGPLHEHYFDRGIHVASWCSRRDLAQTEARRWGKYFVTVTIVEAELQPSNARTAKAFNDSGVFAPFTVIGEDL